MTSLALLLLIGLLLPLAWRLTATRRTRVPRTRTEQRERRDAADRAAPRRVTPSDQPEPKATTPATNASPPPARPGYLLATPRGAPDTDRLRRILDAMSGPGVCTPRDG